MLDKTNYSSWESRMLLYIKGKEHGKLLVDLVLNEPFQYRTLVVLGKENTLAMVREQTYTDLTDDEKICESVDIKATNIVLQGLPQDIYNLVNHNEHVKQIWDRVKLLIQVNTKFVNHLQPEWSKFVTDVKLAKYKHTTNFDHMHTTNFDHLYAHLRQHEAHANEVRLARQMYLDQIALVANSPSCLNLTQYYPQLSSASQQSYPSSAPERSYDAPIIQQSQYQPQVATHSQVVQQQTYQAPALQQSYQAPAIHQPTQPSFLELDSGLVVPSFKLFDDPIANLNKAMINQATIQDERVTVQKVQGRQTQGYANNKVRTTTINLGVNRQRAPVQARVVKCYNCQEEGHFARQCTKPKRRKNSTWFKEKMLMSKALESRAYLDPEQLAFLADNRDTIIQAQASQEIPTPATFQTNDLDAFDSDCDDVLYFPRLRQFSWKIFLLMT
ncbi:retrovirus-related pol polyprotein from transposon TNT 1-94 [Tanacetum coccineum]